MLRRVALVRTDVSEERSASIVWVTRIGELGATLAVTSNRRNVREDVGVGISVCVCVCVCISELYNAVTRCTKEPNKFYHQSKSRLGSPKHLIIPTYRTI
jgi:hypothetical protein